jgi:peptidoglycan/LPS O-acetylase OafA/YrhL
MVNLTGLTITYFLGVIICLPLLFKSSLFVNENINKLSKLTFGIYLVHILPLALFNRIGIDGWLLPTLTFFTSALTIHLLNIFIPIKYRRLFI